jgi:hypothetical protein
MHRQCVLSRLFKFLQGFVGVLFLDRAYIPTPTPTNVYIRNANTHAVDLPRHFTIRPQFFAGRRGHLGSFQPKLLSAAAKRWKRG